MIRAQQLIDRLFEARPRKKAVPPSTPEPVQAEPLMNPDEMTQFVMTGLKYGHLANMLHLIEKYDCDVSGRVRRTSSHYVHYNTIEFTWEVDVYDSNTVPPEDYALIGKLADKIQDEVDNEIKEISKKIYRALESAYEWSVSDEAVADNIIGNEYTFNQDGERADEGDDEDDGEGLFQYDQLSDAAKQKAREWHLEGDRNDESYSEPVIEEWKQELENIGFGDPDISYSGFWSQGDGASFTCSHFDFKKYAHFFMSGGNTERSRPYTDELYAEEYRREAEAARGAPPPVAESDLGIDMEQFTRDSIYTDFSSLAQYDPKHERYNAPWEKHYATSKQAKDNKFFVRLNIYDASRPDKNGTVRVELYAQAWEDTADFHRKNAGNVNRKVRFFVPPGEKSKLIALLLDYWLNAKGVADRRDNLGKLQDPMKMCRSLAHRLSLLAGLWKQGHRDTYNAHLDAQAKAHMDAMTPEQKAALEKRREEWIAKHPEPSDEKLALRAEMKKWKAERDVAARQAVPPPPAQESEEDDLLTSMGDVAIRGAVNNIGNIMLEQPVRYMSGAKQYHWHETTPDWRWKITVDVTVYDEQLPGQPWEANISVRNNEAGKTYRIDKLVVTPNEKNNFGIGIQKLIPIVQDISERSWDEAEQLLRELEIAFNKSLGERETASPNHKISTFYEY